MKTIDDEMNFSKSKILVTGGLGFIGKHLCRKLLQLGFEVICLDDESASTDDAEDFILKNNINFSKFKLVCGSILDNSLLTNLICQNVDLIFHLAAKLGVKNIIDNQLEMLETNVDGTKNVLDLASSFRIPTFVASSSEVYAKNEEVPFKEDSDLKLGSPNISRWGYAASKILDEFQALANFRECQLPVVIGRFFNIVGPGQSPESGMVIPKMISAALEGKPLCVLGDGQQRRCFCHVDDCVQALCSLMLNDEVFKKAYGQIFNIGNPKNELSILQLASKIKDDFFQNIEIELRPYQEIYQLGTFEDMARRIPDINKIKQIASWKPLKTIDRILKDEIKWMKASELVTS